MTKSGLTTNPTRGKAPMAWRRQSTTVSMNAELEDFEEEQLLQGLINSGWITEAEAETIMLRQQDRSLSSPFSMASYDPDYLDSARRAARSGNRHDAIHYIEHFLGREWIGVLQ